MGIFINKNEINNNNEIITVEEISNLIYNDELHIVFGDKLFEQLLEVNVRFKGDNSRVIMIRNIYKDGSNNHPISHINEPSLKYIYGNRYYHGSDKGLPILIPEQFNGKVQIQGKAADKYSVADIDKIGLKIIKSFLKEESQIMREYWFLNPDVNTHDAIRFEQIKEYFINKYSNKRF